MKFAFVPLYIKILGIESYGLIGIFTLVQAWFIILDLGLSPSISREMSRFNSGVLSVGVIRDILRSIETIAFIVAGLIFLGAFFYSEWMAEVFVSPSRLEKYEVENALFIMGIIAALRFYEGIYHYVLIGLERQVLLNIVNGAMITIRNVGALLVLIYIHPTIYAFFIWQGACSIMETLILIAIIYKILPKGRRAGRFSLDALRVIKFFASSMLILTVLSLLISQVDKLIVVNHGNLKEFGYYSLAATISSILAMITSSVIQASYPRMVRLIASGDNQKVISTYHQSVQLVTIVIASIATIVSIYSENIVLIWTNDFEISVHTAPILSVMIIGAGFFSLSQLPQQCQIAHNHLSLPLMSNLLILIFLTISTFFGMYEFGIMGVVWAVAICMFAFFLLSSELVHFYIFSGEKKKFYVEGIILPIIGVFLPMSFLAIFYRDNNLNRIESVLFYILVSILTIFCSLIFSNEIRSSIIFHIRNFKFKIRFK